MAAARASMASRCSAAAAASARACAAAASAAAARASAASRCPAAAAASAHACAAAASAAAARASAASRCSAAAAHTCPAFAAADVASSLAASCDQRPRQRLQCVQMSASGWLRYAELISTHSAGALHAVAREAGLSCAAVASMNFCRATAPPRRCCHDLGSHGAPSICSRARSASFERTVPVRADGPGGQRLPGQGAPAILRAAQGPWPRAAPRRPRAPRRRRRPAGALQRPPAGARPARPRPRSPPPAAPPAPRHAPARTRPFLLAGERASSRQAHVWAAAARVPGCCRTRAASAARRPLGGALPPAYGLSAAAAGTAHTGRSPLSQFPLPSDSR